MSDFIFSKKNIEQNIITREIQSIYDNDKPVVEEFHGEWGSLGISRNLYYGFNPYESDDYIVVVIGGPVLMFRDNSFLNHKNSTEGSEAIFKRWISGELKWDEDLSGPFVVLIVNKETNEVTCITDLMSFIPVYMYRDSSWFVLSTHVDVLASLSKQKNKIDEISVADFILHGIVTYPYTTYKRVFQISPATEHSISVNSAELKSISYWIPREINKYKTIGDAAVLLRNGLKNYIEKITKITSNIAQFISGGEDSRTLSALLKDYPREAFIFLDHLNREGKIAQQVANAYGAKFNIATRNKLHYLNILPNCSDLVGSGSQYHHAHTYGFHKTKDLDSYTAVFGGLLSDALLKGSHIKRIRGSDRFSFLPDIRAINYTSGKKITNEVIKTTVLSELRKRRKAHLEYVKNFRGESAEEWFELWPSSMNSNIPNIHANRRLFRSYEPFMSKDIVKISASVPQKWKMNRRLFQKAVKPLLKPTKWLIHTDGRLPYFPWYINVFIQFITWFYRHIAKRIGLIKGNQGPWGEWNVLVNSIEWKQAFVNYSKGVNKISHIFNDERLEQLIVSDKLSTQQYVNLTQALYQIDNAVD